EEMNDFTERFLTAEEHPNAQLLLQEVERDKEEVLLQMDILDRIAKAKTDILKIYAELYANRTVWPAQQKEKIKQIEDIVGDCRNLFVLTEGIEGSCASLYQRLEKDDLQWTDQLFLLTDMVAMLEMLESCVVEQI
ncbi:MAG: hypothetical protein K2O34_10065, partial [Acetatifactor sp.]|nr:hypothetical protein [Acetatifactor sp.]